MNPRNIVVAVVAIVGALVVGLMVRGYLTEAEGQARQELQNQQARVEPQIPTVQVLVAKADLVVGTFVRKEDLHWQIWPEESVAPTYVTQGKKITELGEGEKKLTIKDFTGAVVRLPIAAGQPMTPGLVARAGDRGFLAAVLRPGMRAISIGVNATSGIAGFILPGDRVDLIWGVAKKTGTPFTQTLMTDIRVIAIDQKTQANKASPAKTVTLELTPKQVEALSLANSMGRIEFALRSIAPEQQDDDPDGLGGTLLADASDGLEGGGLLGAGLIAAEEQEEIVEIKQDSYTVDLELYYKRDPKKRGLRGLASGLAGVAGVASAVGGGGKSSKGAAAPAGQTSGKYAIRIVRGVTTQTIKLKK